MHDGWSATALAALAAVAACPAARAAPLEVHPPPGFAVKPISKDGASAAEFEVSSTSDDSFGCQIGFDASKAMAGTSQAEIDAAMPTPAYREAVKASLSASFDVLSLQPFAARGATGLALTSVPHGGEGQVKGLLFILQTPPGRTSVVCMGPPDRFGALVPSFEAIARGVTLPR